MPNAIARLRINAPPKDVFDAWTRPEILGRWMFGPAVREEEVIHLQCDLRLGGPFSFLVKRLIQGESREIDHIGEYLEIDSPRRLAFTWSVRGESPRSRVIVEIQADGNGSLVEVTHEMAEEWVDFVGKVTASWELMLSALERAMAK